MKTLMWVGTMLILGGGFLTIASLLLFIFDQIEWPGEFRPLSAGRVEEPAPPIGIIVGMSVVAAGIVAVAVALLTELTRRRT